MMLKPLLEEFLRVEGVSAAVVVGRDGFVIESAVSGKVDIEALGAMASTGLGACHAIGHALGGRFDIAHGVALTMVLPGVLAFSLPECAAGLADVAFALGAGDTAADTKGNASSAISAVAELARSVRMVSTLADFGIAACDFQQIAADALDDEVIANAPVQPTAQVIEAILAGALGGSA